MALRRVVKGLLWTVLVLLVLAALIAGGTWWYFHPAVRRTNNIAYGTRGGQALALDVIEPSRPNGRGVLALVSGGWKSGTPGSFREWMAAPLLRRGYTVFAVYHVSQPNATVMEIVEDMHRAVRFVRHHARDYGVDPWRLGVTGGSAGGHLSLMLAARGEPGPPNSIDPVDRESSAVQAVAVFFPVTDLLNLGRSTENSGDGGPPKSFVKAFGPQATDLAIWKTIGHQVSPIYHITTNLPPVLIYHGNADTLVPLEQSEWFQARARESGRDVRIVVHSGGSHGWPTMLLDVRGFADWFDRYLQRDRPQPAPKPAAKTGPCDRIQPIVRTVLFTPLDNPHRRAGWSDEFAFHNDERMLTSRKLESSTKGIYAGTRHPSKISHRSKSRAGRVLVVRLWTLEGAAVLRWLA